MGPRHDRGFYHVLEDELDLIQKRRRQLEQPPEAVPDEPSGRLNRDQADSGGLVGASEAARDVDSFTRQARLRALSEHTTGLALAGEGERGANVAVGFLEGLAALGLIRRMDYLSASSSGGAAAAWLAAWLSREGGDPANVERQLAQSRIEEARARRQYLASGEVVDEEPQPLRHLRAYSGSAEPRAGIRWTDGRIYLASWARNVMIRVLVLVLLLVTMAAGARLIVALYGVLDELTPLEEQAAQFDSRLGAPSLRWASSHWD